MKSKRTSGNAVWQGHTENPRDPVSGKQSLPAKQQAVPHPKGLQADATAGMRGASAKIAVGKLGR